MYYWNGWQYVWIPCYPSNIYPTPYTSTYSLPRLSDEDVERIATAVVEKQKREKS